MSVAFRRESDEEHLEPKFELPIPLGPNLVTEAGLAQITARAAALEAAIGNESDDAEIKRLRRDLRYWNTQHATAQIASSPAPDEAGIGSRVTIRLNGKPRSFTIVGHDEADPAAGLIAFTAPLARAAMGGMVGEKLPFAGAEDALEIVAIG